MNKRTVSVILLTLLLIAMLSLAVNIQPVKAPPLPRLYLNPVVSVAMLGESFTVNLMVADVALLYAWQVNMSFNPTVLQFVNVTEGPFLMDQPEGTWTVPPVIGYGWVLFGWMTEGPYLGVSGSGWLATVEFLVLNIGESILNIDDPLTKLFRYNPPPLPPGKDIIEPIPHTRENGYFITTPPVLTATIDIYPDTLHLTSKGKWITVYIELPEDYDVKEIDVSTILLNETISAKLHPVEAGDYDRDTIPDLMVKFNRTEVISLIIENLGSEPLESTEITLMVSGQLHDRTPFEGSDISRVDARAFPTCGSRAFWFILLFFLVHEPRQW